MKIFIQTIILLIISSSNIFAQGVNKISVNTHPIIMGDFYENYIAIGQLKLSNSKDYFAQISGKVDFISPTQGVQLLKDYIVIAIDSDVAEKSQNQSQANLYVAQSNYNRDLLLFEKKVISVEGVDKSKAALEQAKNDYAKMTQSYNNMIIKLPEDGYLGVIKASVGDEIKVGDYLFSFTRSGNFYTFIDLPENMHGKVLIADTVKVKNRDGEWIDGKFVAISDYVSNNGTINAKVEFPFNESLLHGAFSEIKIIFNSHKALSLPEKAVLKNNQGNFVYTITKDDKVKQVFVKLGIRTNNMIELLSEELKEGDSVVIDGLTKIHDGIEVIVQKK